MIREQSSQQRGVVLDRPVSQEDWDSKFVEWLVQSGCSLSGRDSASDEAAGKPARPRKRAVKRVKKPRVAEAASNKTATQSVPPDTEVSADAESPEISWPDPRNNMAAISRKFWELANKVGMPVLYWEGWGWYVHDGTRYEQHTDEEFEQVLYRFFGPLHHEKYDGRSKKKQYVPFNPDSTFLKKCRESMRAKALRKNLVHDTWLDERKDRVIPLRNGLFDMDSGIFTYGHDPKFFNTYCLSFDYNENATCERFDQLLEETWPDDPGARVRFLQYLGVILSGQTNLQKMLLMIGRTGSGKSVLAWLMEQMVAPEAYAPMDSQSLVERFGVSALIGKKLGIFQDAREAGRTKNLVPMLLRLTCEDSVSAEIKNVKMPWTGRLGIRLVYVSNVPPALPDNAQAVRRRLLPLWFEHSVPSEQQDVNLKDKLSLELPGILNRVLEELQKFEVGGCKFADAPSAEHVIEMVSAKSSPLRQWLEDECVVGGSQDLSSSDHTWTPTEALYDAWRQWCEANGHHPGSSAWLGTELRGAVEGIEPKRKKIAGKQVRGYAGIALAEYEPIRPDLSEEGGRANAD